MRRVWTCRGVFRRTTAVPCRRVARIWCLVGLHRYVADLSCDPGSATVVQCQQVFGRIGVSLPDVVLLIATLLSLPALARLGTPIGVTKLRRWFCVYLIAMIAIVLIHPDLKGLIEAGHRTLLVVGALSVGAWISIEGYTRLVLRLLIGVAVPAGLIYFVAGVVNDFSPSVSLLGLNKNYIGFDFRNVHSRSSCSSRRPGS